MEKSHNSSSQRRIFFRHEGKPVRFFLWRGFRSWNPRPRSVIATAQTGPSRRRWIIWSSSPGSPLISPTRGRSWFVIMARTPMPIGGKSGRRGSLPSPYGWPRRKRSASHPRGWAAMIRKVYEVNPMVCPKCGGLMKVVAFITDYQAVDRISDHLKLRFIAEKPPPSCVIE